MDIFLSVNSMCGQYVLPKRSYLPTKLYSLINLRASIRSVYLKQNEGLIFNFISKLGKLRTLALIIQSITLYQITEC
jgi:hypothetical protein